MAGGMAWGCRGPNSIARRSTPCQAASVRGQSNQMLSEVLRAGRASTAGLSPLSTPDSILLCYQKSKYCGVDELGVFTQIGVKWIECENMALVFYGEDAKKGLHRQYYPYNVTFVCWPNLHT